MGHGQGGRSPREASGRANEALRAMTPSTYSQDVLISVLEALSFLFGK